MPISLHIEAVNADDLKAMIHGLAGLVGGDAGEADNDKPAPKRQTRAKKTETKPDPEKSDDKKVEADSDVKPEAGSDGKPSGKDADDDQKLEPKTVDDVKAIMAEMIDKLGDDGPAKAYELLQEFDVQKASQLSDEQCAEYFAKAEKILADA